MKKHKMLWSVPLTVWNYLGMDTLTLKKMVRLSVAPTVAIAICQSDYLANHFTEDGYFVAIMAFATAPVLPRSKLVRWIFDCAIGISLATALCLFANWTAIQARNHTTEPGAAVEKYNSSQSAVLAVWLLFLIYVQAFFQAANPQYQMPAMSAGLVLVPGLTSTVTCTSMDQVVTYMTILMETYLLGIGLSLVAGVFVFPETSRGIFFNHVTTFLEALKSTMSSQMKYLQSIENLDPWFQFEEMEKEPLLADQNKCLKSLHEAAANARAEQPSAETQIAHGKLDADDISALTTSILRIMPALSGIGVNLNNVATAGKRLKLAGSVMERQAAIMEWRKVMAAIHQPGETLLYAMMQAVNHVLISLELKSLCTDPVASNSPPPGSPGFAEWYSTQIDEYSNIRNVMATLWSKKDHRVSPADSDEKKEFAEDVWAGLDFENKHRRAFTIIYIHYLFVATSRELCESVQLVDRMIVDGRLSRRRWIFPNIRKIPGWLGYVCDICGTGWSTRTSARAVLHSMLQDPEHLPPSNRYERVGNTLRHIPKLFRSRASAHAFRVACAVMTLAVGFYIRTSSAWFQRYRWLWAMFTVIMTMNDSAGLSTFMFLCRTVGTALALVSAFIVYYIVDEKPAGVIVFMWIYFLVVGYLLSKFSFYTSVFMVSSLAIICMAGNELQDKKLGFERVNATGQAAYNEYALAPLRLGIVCAGNVVAYFWTIFPYPISEHTELRKGLGTTLRYLANYHAIISQTINSRIEGNETIETRNHTRLAQARVQCFTKLQSLFTRLRKHLTFSRWQVMLGGKFPEDKYSEMITLCEEICTAGSVMGLASASFIRVIEESEQADSEVDDWMHGFQQLLGTVAETAEDITSALVVLSNHMTNATPFPPFTHSPDGYTLAKKLDDLKPGMLNIEHAAKPAYAAFVTMTIARRNITRALDRQLEIAKELLGVLDFSSFVDVEEQPFMLSDEDGGGGRFTG